MNAGQAVVVEGLRESIKGLKSIDKALPRVVSKAARDIAKEIVAPEAQKRWRDQRIKPSVATQVIKGSGTTAGGQINVRYKTFPYAAGVEYGAKQFGQFRPWRGNRFTVAPGTSTGYVAQDAIRDTLPEVEKRWNDEVMDLVKKELSAHGTVF